MSAVIPISNPISNTTMRTAGEKLDYSFRGKL